MSEKIDNSKQKHYLVTGGAGFIGSHLVDRLLDAGHKVTVVDDLSTGREENIKYHFGNNDFKFYNEDICLWDQVGFNRFDGIFHLAARARIQPSIEDPVGYDFANVHGTVRMLEIARKQKCRIVFSSSSSVYGGIETLPFNESMPVNPLHPYGLQKFFGEKYCELFGTLYGLSWIALRYFNVYGERQLTDGAYATVIGIFLKQFKEGKPFTIVGDGTQKRDFTYVGDVVEANLKAMESGYNGMYNIGRGRHCSVRDIADAISEKHPRQYGIERRAEAKETLADIFQARYTLHWEPEIDVVEWIKKQVHGSH